MKKAGTSGATTYDAVETAIDLSKVTGTWEELLVKATCIRPWAAKAGGAIAANNAEDLPASTPLR
jgi:hypothetical protein